MNINTTAVLKCICSHRLRGFGLSFVSTTLSYLSNSYASISRFTASPTRAPSLTKTNPPFAHLPNCREYRERYDEIQNRWGDAETPIKTGFKSSYRAPTKTPWPAASRCLHMPYNHYQATLANPVHLPMINVPAMNIITTAVLKCICSHRLLGFGVSFGSTPTLLLARLPDKHHRLRLIIVFKQNDIAAVGKAVSADGLFEVQQTDLARFVVAD